MTWVSVGVAGVSIIGGAITKRRAKKKGDKEAKKIQAKKAVQGKELQKEYDAEAMSQRDLANELEGQATISPETQYARNQSERATASAIDKAGRTGSSTSEIMNMVSGLTSRGQMAGERISANESERKGRLKTGAKMARTQSARTKRSGKEAQIALSDQALGQEMNARQNISQSEGEMFNMISGAVGDIGAAYLYSGAGAGSKAPLSYSNMNPETAGKLKKAIKFTPTTE